MSGTGTARTAGTTGATGTAGAAGADRVTQAAGTTDASETGGQSAPDLRLLPYDTEPGQYRHWRLSTDGPVATLTLDVAEDGGLLPGYQLKMNSYDLGVYLELYDAVQRLRFEHPQVRAVVLTSGRERSFCAGANIGMLASASHAWKVNFCKFCNETLAAIEDATACSGQTYIAALNGTAAGGGYEMAMACDQIVLIDDGSSVVALPEVPQLGVLPGTGGLTRLTDKRGVRRDRADVFATTPEGVRGARAVDWRLVDATVKARDFRAEIAARAQTAAGQSARRTAEEQPGVALTTLRREMGAGGERIQYDHLLVEIDRRNGTATLTLPGPGGLPGGPADPAGQAGPDRHARTGGQAEPGGQAAGRQGVRAGVPETLADLHRQGAAGWALAAVRELDDAITRLRAGETEAGTWLLKTSGDPAAVLALDELLLRHRDEWLVNEIIQYWKRVLRRLEATSRSLIALIEPGSCFAGLLLELALAADRQYMLDGIFTDEPEPAPAAVICLDEFSAGLLPGSGGRTRLAARFGADQEALAAALAASGRLLAAAEAAGLGLVTEAPDDLDWADELRLVVAERASFSPDALTGMEASLRYPGPETGETKILGRLTAWQNWIFQRPNAAGPGGALRRYGTGQRADYDRRRV